ncbi:MAG: sarcosine oxidase subunit delta [Shimia thalassica]|uniref:sarcosine oxidase subunit delta n=1 Tax=Shimia thalassica TaxID=1715693 RepID=UPI0032985BAF
MLLIPCPHCGPRDESEFVYGGATRAQPALDGKTTVQDWQNALHQRTNPRGPIEELWFHSGGCETWITVTRDTLSHQFLDAP